MKLLLMLLSMGTAAHAGRPHRYLLSLCDLPLEKGESLESFSLETWGVEFNTVCRVPLGWRIEAGGSATPEGVLKGRGSLGATWFNQRKPAELQRFVLITLHGPVLLRDHGAAPATFNGFATINADDGDQKRPLTHRNVRLVSAEHCPTR